MNEPPLRLAFLADARSVHSSRWLNYFADRGHSVTLLLGLDDEVGSGLDERVRVHRYRRSGPRLPFVSILRSRGALRHALATVRPEILHAHYLSRNGWQARLSGFHPYVVTPWGSDLLIAASASPRARVWAWATLRGADLVTAPSAHLAGVAKAFGARSDRLHRVPFGVDTSEYSPAAPNRHLLESVGILANRIVFSPRGVKAIYRQHLVIEALPMLPDDVMAVLPTRNAEPQTLRALCRRVKELDLESRVVAIEDIPPRVMPEIYRAASVVVSIPTSDGLPASVLEAMSCGTPVVISDLPGPREALGASAEQLVLRNLDAHALAIGIDRVLRLGEAERLELGAALRQRAVDEFDYRGCMQQMERLYLSIRERQ